MLLLIGPTRAGKGVIARVLKALVGRGNYAGPTLASLGTNFGLSPLIGKPLAIVSDAIFTPGRNLRELLRGAGMLEHFDFFVFSDEIGRSKPHPAVYEAVAVHYGISIESIVHIGDRPHNDLGGPHAVGARGVLLTVVKNRPLEGHIPDAVCDDYAELPEVLEAME